MTSSSGAAGKTQQAKLLHHAQLPAGENSATTAGQNLTMPVTNENSQRSLPAELIHNTFDDIKESVSQFLLIRVIFEDIRRRVGAEYHLWTVINGALLLPLTLVAYCLTLELNPPANVETQYRHYVTVAIIVGLIGQMFFTLGAIATENAAMLLAANICAIALGLRVDVRPLLDDDGDSGRRASRYVFQALLSVEVIAHVITSYLAYQANDGFRRFIFFAIGGTSEIQERYRKFQMWVASSRIDLFFTLLTALSVGFFCVVSVWHYLILVFTVIVNAIWRSVLLRVIRTETCLSDCMQVDPPTASSENDNESNSDWRGSSRPVPIPQSKNSSSAAAATGTATSSESKKQQQEEKEEAPLWRGADESQLSNAENHVDTKPNASSSNNNNTQQSGGYGSTATATTAAGGGGASYSSSTIDVSQNVSQQHLEEHTAAMNTVPSWSTFWCLVIPLNAVSPVILGLAMFEHDFIASRVHASLSFFLVLLTFALFICARVLLTVATIVVWRNFGRGMQAVFARERSVTEYLLGTNRGKTVYSSKKMSSSTGGNNNNNNPASPQSDATESESGVLRKAPSDAFERAAAAARNASL